MFEKQGEYVILNGEIIKREKALVSMSSVVPNFNLHYCEVMHGNGGEVQFVYEHFESIDRYCRYQKLNYPVEFKNNFQLIRRDIEKLMHKNRLFQGVQVELHIFASRQNNEEKAFNYYVDICKIEFDHFVLNKTGLRMDIFTNQNKQITPMAGFNLEAQSYQLEADIFVRENKLDDCFIINNQGNIIESIKGSVFIVKNDTLYTPSLAEGCINRVIRSKVIDVAILKGYRMLEVAMLTPEILLDADEVLIANSIKGICWVSAVRQRRYFNKQAQKLVGGLNELAFGIK